LSHADVSSNDEFKTTTAAADEQHWLPMHRANEILANLSQQSEQKLVEHLSTLRANARVTESASGSIQGMQLIGWSSDEGYLITWHDE